MEQVIYVGEPDTDIAGQIQERLSKGNHQIKIYSENDSLESHLELNAPDLMIFNDSFLNKYQIKQDLFNRFPTLVYSRQMEMEKKLNYYRMGAKRVLVDSEDLVDEVVSSTNMILFRRGKLKEIRENILNYGTIQDSTLIEILHDAVKENKNLLIKLKYHDLDINLKIFQGHIVNVHSPNGNGSDALLKALLIPEGYFIIRRYKKDQEKSQFSSSVLAILTELTFFQNKIQKFLESFDISNPKCDINSSNNLPEFSVYESQIIKLVLRYGSFRDVLIRSPLPVNRSLQIFIDLHKNGTIYLLESEISSEKFRNSDIKYLQKNIFGEDFNEGRILVLGVPTSGKGEFIRKIAGHENSEIKSVQFLDYARIRLKNKLVLSLFGISIDENFQPILDKISEDILAVILLIDNASEESFEYTKYLFQKMLYNYDVPFVVGIENTKSGNDETIRKIRSKLDIPDSIEIVSYDPRSFRDCINLFYHLKTVTKPLRKRNHG
jgi:signal recognition particle receptor subunit beta